MAAHEWVTDVDLIAVIVLWVYFASLVMLQRAC